MKKNKMKYRLVVDGKVKLLTAKALYKEHIKGCWQTLNHVPYQSKSIVVEWNLASSDKEPTQWIKVKLLFVRSVNEAKQQASRHDWALFLKEQGRHYSAYIVSIHLTGLRFCLLLFTK